RQQGAVSGAGSVGLADRRGDCGRAAGRPVSDGDAVAGADAAVRREIIVRVFVLVCAVRLDRRKPAQFQPRSIYRRAAALSGMHGTLSIDALQLSLYPWLLGGALGALRLAPLFFMLPFLNSGVLAGAPRQATIMLVALSLWPHAPAMLPAF